MDMASSVAVVALQHYLCIKDEIPPTFLGTSWNRDTFDAFDTGDPTCHRSGQHRQRIKPPAYADEVEKHLVPSWPPRNRAWGWGSQGLDMGKGTARGRREGPLKDEFLPMAPHQLNHQGHKRKDFSAEQWHWDQDLHLEYDSDRAEHSLPRISRCLSTGSQYKMKPLYSVKAMPDTNNCFHVKSWWLVPI